MSTPSKKKVEGRPHTYRLNKLFVLVAGAWKNQNHVVGSWGIVMDNQDHTTGTKDISGDKTIKLK